MINHRDRRAGQEFTLRVQRRGERVLGEIYGWVAPDPLLVTQTLAAGETVTFSGNYEALLGIPFWPHFSDGVADHFEVVSGVWEVVDGSYSCFNGEPGERHLSAVGNYTWTDYRVGVGILSHGSPNQEFLFRYQSPVDYYRYVVLPSPYNRAEIWKCVAGKEVMLLGLPNVNNVDGVKNWMEIEAVGSRIRAYFNQELLFEIHDFSQPFVAGGIALSAYAHPDVGWHDVAFDRFAVIPHDYPTDVPAVVPSGLSLSAHPNPFNPFTKIPFSIPKSGEITVAIYDLRGRLVRELLSEYRQVGEHQVDWDGRDRHGGTIASGVYLVRLKSSDGEQRAVKVTLSK